jgi:hypothetical protein
LKNLHIENSYNIWHKNDMFTAITEKSKKDYGNQLADKVLNRSYRGMYVEWWLHNAGYWATRPFTKNTQVAKLNERFKHLDLEEHTRYL